MIPRWIFDEHEMGRKERNPVNEEFFANNTPLAAIIREGIHVREKSVARIHRGRNRGTEGPPRHLPR